MHLCNQIPPADPNVMAGAGDVSGNVPAARARKQEKPNEQK